MSIYSGFATRNQEDFYNRLVEKLISMMSEKIVANFNGQSLPDEISWSKKITKIHKTLAYMEQNKYLEPRYSYCFDDLTALLKSSGNISDSTRMSRISGVDKIQVKRKNFKSLPLSPKSHTTKGIRKNSTQKAELKFLASSEMASTPNIDNTSITEEEKRRVTSTKRRRMPTLAAEFKNHSKVRRNHNNSQVPKDVGLESNKKETGKNNRYWPHQAMTSLSNKNAYCTPADTIKIRFKANKTSLKSISGNTSLHNASLTLKDVKLGKIMMNGRIKPVKLRHHLRVAR
ncbi:unnamed protein product [Moneuplotes crassus]|uniref:Uncharacterized protein n=1 Tax=Euplotes crassus TaxID=5936 RepID=A0AAD1XRB0_EUPCR|nr:unnamed protein product [Moneuplotes crassus]